MKLVYRTYPTTQWLDSQATTACCATMRDFMDSGSNYEPSFDQRGIMGSEGNFYHPLKFCPWCGEPIDYGA